MYTGSLPAIARGEDWIENSPLINEDNEEILLTDATIEMYVCRQGCPDSPLLTATTGNGKITLINADLAYQWSFTKEETHGLCAGTYDVFQRVTISAVRTQIMSATIPIVEGGPA
jgi:hypothetical protein